MERGKSLSKKMGPKNLMSQAKEIQTMMEKINNLIHMQLHPWAK